MPWILEKIEHAAWAAKYGRDLHDTSRYDPYDLACIIEDRGDRIAYISNAVGNGRIPNRGELQKILIDLGFERIRWVRVIFLRLASPYSKVGLEMLWGNFYKTNFFDYVQNILRLRDALHLLQVNKLVYSW